MYDVEVLGASRCLPLLVAMTLTLVSFCFPPHPREPNGPNMA